MKYIIMLLLVTFNVMSCEQIYQNDVFRGCKLSSSDRMLNTYWMSLPQGIYLPNITQGVSIFYIDKYGTYSAVSYSRNILDNCLQKSNPWTGQLYKLGKGVYSVFNEFSIKGSYLLLVDKTYNNATSVLLGPDESGETDILTRTNKPNDLVYKFLDQYTCK